MESIYITQEGLNKIGDYIIENFQELQDIILHHEINFSPSTIKHIGLNSIYLFFELTFDNTQVNIEALSELLKQYVGEKKILSFELSGKFKLTANIQDYRQLVRPQKDVQTFILFIELIEENYNTRLVRA